MVAKQSQTLWISFSVARLVWIGIDRSRGSALSKNGFFPPNIMVWFELAARYSIRWLFLINSTQVTKVDCTCCDRINKCWLKLKILKMINGSYLCESSFIVAPERSTSRFRMRTSTWFIISTWLASTLFGADGVWMESFVSYKFSSYSDIKIQVLIKLHI